MCQDEPVLNLMAPITLSEMGSIRLMNRVDTKYLTDRATLSGVLSKACGRGYLVFEEGGRVLGYRTLYYDTPDLRMYLDHHNRRLVRQKLRTRQYESGLSYLELKSKDNHGRTKKKRVEIAPDEFCSGMLSADGKAWLEGRLRYPPEGLSPALETNFSRITLVDPGMRERATIDMDISFVNRRSGASRSLGDVVIIEVKQDGNFRSVLKDILLEFRVKPVRISKYCIGTAMTDPSVRRGRFKGKIRLINKILKRYD